MQLLLYSILTVLMHYERYSTEDFIQDDFFQRWVFSPNEERDHFWNAFLLHYPGQRENVQEAREFLLAMKFERNVPESVVHDIKFNIDRALAEHESAERSIERSSHHSADPRKRSVFLTIYSIAASLLLLAMVTGYFMIREGINFKVFETLTYEKEETGQGKQRRLTLADGTQVWLNAGSALKFPRDFTGKQSREVYLHGEAFFDVSEDKVKPFIVHTSELAIRVLGTAFNVRSYEGDPVVETTLVRGKVSIASASTASLPEITLLPNQQALFSKESNTIALAKAVNTEPYIAWKNGWMIFENKPFSYIKETLERWYNVTLMMEDEKSLTCTFSAKFKDKTLQQVLEIFSNTESISYRIEGDKVFIKGKLCNYENVN